MGIQRDTTSHAGKSKTQQSHEVKQWEPKGGDQPSPQEAHDRLLEILKAHHAAMMFSVDDDGRIQGRPMGWARIDDDGTLYFSTGADSKKIAELEAHPEVTLSVQGKADYAVVRGTARISQDRALIRELWEDSWKVWFPEGVDDPTIAIVVVSPDEGTYWDQKSTQGLSFLFRLAKARLTGNAVEIEQGDVQHVPLR